MTLFTPRPMQQDIISHILSLNRCGVFSGMGTGKTAATLEALELRNLVDSVYPALVLAPIRVARTTWVDEVDKWDNFKHLRISAVTGDKNERLAALRKKADIYTINYENIGWLIETLGGSWQFKTIVADELTKLKSYRLGGKKSKGRRSKLLSSVAFKSKFFIGLTGTPSPNGLKDLWGQTWFIDKGERLGRSFAAFESRWFRKGYDGFSILPLPHSENEIHDKIKDICVSIEASNYMNIDEPIFNTIEVKLPVTALKHYKDMQRKMFIELQGTEIEAFNAAAKTQKLLQLANGAAYLDDKGSAYSETHKEKLLVLEEVIEEANGMPVLVAYNFRSDLERLKKHFPQGKELDSSTQTIRDWNAGKIPVMFTHPASAGHGLNLQQGGNILVFFGLNWNLEEHLQIIERIGPMRQKQAGLNRAVFVHYIVAKGTIDEMVIERLKGKRSVQDTLMEALRRFSLEGES